MPSPSDKIVPSERLRICSEHADKPPLLHTLGELNISHDTINNEYLVSARFGENSRHVVEYAISCKDGDAFPSRLPDTRDWPTFTEMLNAIDSAS